MASVVVMTQPSPRYLLVEERLGEPLSRFIAERRAREVSWRRIALEIYQRTHVDITGEGVRLWHQGQLADEPAA